MNDGTDAPLALGIALLGVLASLITGPGAEGLYGAFLAVLMLAVAAHDARHYLIPNELTGAAFALALIRAAALVPDIGLEALLWPLARAGAVALPLLLLMALYRRWRGRDGLGLGDVKLAAVCGAWLDLVTVAAVIELSALLAIGAYAANAARQRQPLRATAFLPFGLFLAPAIWLGWLGETWYANRLGGWPG
ncbi:prepilin peptidase [Bradyrhizobium sacchari]|uniref:Leader peptidase (Prepilin peptidase)/N-methyltransferase n=1 Tax=Bradyrhizobium sacchari TaxID=1399419 RepID=A0A560JMU3_9BRAD|nr:A24 family peptidase [Bradyrhizobium sacchari]TWB59152.1 leader peptidase (prepilin peptidase)/N-methyltransferase [Bradyrhizobium sacchari]TWB72488.1 leader peptidase (prepilin peptidase)/N-methyltransferase [Bradyrhizobium sacchari]